jgi:hypothetical protein
MAGVTQNQIKRDTVPHQWIQQLYFNLCTHKKCIRHVQGQHIFPQYCPLCWCPPKYLETPPACKRVVLGHGESQGASQAMGLERSTAPYNTKLSRYRKTVKHNKK